jgi:phage terminase small subunit
MQSLKTDLRETLFVKHLLDDPDMNLGQAAIKAGYSEKSAKKIGWKLGKKANVQHLLRKFRERIEARTGITKARVLNELARLGFSDIGNYFVVENGRVRFNFEELTRAERAAIQELTIEETAEGKGKNRRPVTRTKLKLANKREALELLGRHLKLFENDGQSAQGVAVILVDIPRPGGRNLTQPVPTQAQLPEDVPTKES